MIIADTSGLLAMFNTREPRHADIRAALEARDEPLAISPFVLAELDYLLATRLGVTAELTVLAEIGSGAYLLDHLDEQGLRRCAEVIDRYHDQEIGLADASIVVMAERHRTRTVLTLDHRHFDVLRPLDGGRFTLLP
jgi:uncharacterized protein